jgi:hypothetical protein
MGRIIEQASAVLIDEGIEAKTARFAVELGGLVFRRAFDQWAEAEGATLTIPMAPRFPSTRKVLPRP